MKKISKNPLVSVCIPTYNGEKYLKEALESVRDQTYRSLELVCSDDNSSDSTKKILEEFKEKNYFPVHIFDHKSSGIGANWNNCLKKTQGEFIKFLFQDDVLEPSCIERMMSVLQEDEGVGLVASKRRIIVEENREGEEIEQWINEYGDLQKLFTREGYNILDISLFRSPLFIQNPLNKIAEPSGVLFRKKILSKTGNFREDMIQILDVEFYNRVLRKYKISLIPDKLYGFRIHEKQTTRQNKGKDDEDFRLYDHLLIRNYFWLLEPTARLGLLQKYYPLIAKVYKFTQKSLPNYHRFQ